jgi:hypothetical protein
MAPNSGKHVRPAILSANGASALIHVEDTPVKLFDTMALHVNKAVTLATEIV